MINDKKELFQQIESRFFYLIEILKKKFNFNDILNKILDQLINRITTKKLIDMFSTL